MAKFLFIYRNNSETYYTLSPDEMQQQHQKWQAWMAEGFSKGWMIDGGAGLQKDGRVVSSQKIVSDGPFIETKDMIGGFTMIQADTLDEAAEHAKGCPILLRGGSVEVRPIWTFANEK